MEIHNWLHFKPSYKKAWEAKQKAISKIWGDWDESYKRLPHFMAALMHTNPGSIVWWTFHDTTLLGQRRVNHDEKILRWVF